MGKAGWLVCLDTVAEPEGRVFCFPYAGGGPGTYRLWPQRFSETTEVWSVQPPGRGPLAGERAVVDLFELVVGLGDQIQPYLGVPFVFFGHSLGALVAFELSRYLVREAGIGPTHLVVSGCKAPGVPPRFDPIRDLPDGALLREVDARYGGIPEDIREDPEVWGLMLPALRADLVMAEGYSYVPGPVLSCPITALGGRADASVLEAELMAWRDLTSGSFSCDFFPGGHFFIHSWGDEVAALVAETLGDPEAGARRYAPNPAKSYPLEQSKAGD